MDLGKMINPAIDRGQVIGGFVQGMGWVTTEALVYDAHGHLLSDSATTYKIPNVTDVPADLRLDWFEGPPDPNAVCGGKAVGEPPLLLAIAVWAAAKNAVGSLAPGSDVPLELPATGEELLKRITALRSRSP
jgi:xanthine dehydrogenase large subunit